MSRPGLVSLLVVLAACAGSGRETSSTASTRATSVPATTTTSTTTSQPPTTTSTFSTSSATTTTTSTTTTTTITTTTTTAPSTTLPPAPITYRLPLGDGVALSYGRDHHDYPAADIFADCGSPVVAPVRGVLLEVRPADRWDEATDNPATRGGMSVSMLGDDNVRYYVAHLAAIDTGLAVGDRVDAGRYLGDVGATGRASGCHLHFGISPLCDGTEWKVRRGVIWPQQYLDAWRSGEQASPVTEVTAWSGEHPDGCADALAEPTAPDA